jgi:alpha-L-fucosidase
MLEDFRDRKLGIMIHWGLYSVPAWAPRDTRLLDLLGEVEQGTYGVNDPRYADIDPILTSPYSEWYQNSQADPRTPTAAYHGEHFGDREYASFRADFEADIAGFDARTWASAFGGAGARYLVLITKHHDGYQLWPSAVGDTSPRPGFSSTRDLVGEVAEAVRAQGLMLGLYYSGGFDWCFGEFPVTSYENSQGFIPDTPEYAAYVDAHYRELVERYHPEVLWNDIGSPPGLDVAGLVDWYREQVPGGLINDRFRQDSVPDFTTPEYGKSADIAEQPWEMCRGVGHSFGYNRAETQAETLNVAEAVRLLADVVSKNGNLLLGVGPTSTGEIPQLQAEVLRGLGRWLQVNGDAIFGTRPWHAAEVTIVGGQTGYFTRRGNDELYLIVPGLQAGPVEIEGFIVAEDTQAAVLGAGPVAVRTEAGRTRLQIDAVPVEEAVAIRFAGSDIVHRASRISS